MNEAIIQMPEDSTPGNGDSLSEGQPASGTDRGDTSDTISITTFLDVKVDPSVNRNADYFKIVDISLDGKQKHPRIDIDTQVHTNAQQMLCGLELVKEHNARLVFIYGGSEFCDIVRTFFDVDMLDPPGRHSIIPFQRRSAISLLDSHHGLLPLLRPLTGVEYYMDQFNGAVPIESRISKVYFKPVTKTSMNEFTAKENRWRDPRAELKAHLSRLFSKHAFIGFSDGSRQSFVRLVILDLFHVNCEISRNSVSREIAYASRIDTSGTRLRSHLCCALSYADLSDMAEQMLTAFQATRDGLASMPSRNPLEQNLSDLEMLLSEYHDLTKKIVARYNKLTELSKHTVDVNEAEAVRRLTTLATVFLPLSLASSILAMGSRISELQFRLFDFVGLALILGSLVVIIYFAVRSTASPKFQFLVRDMSFSIWLYGLKNYTITVLMVMGWLVWGLTLTAFIVGMAKDGFLGLKILGYGFAAILGLAPLISIPAAIKVRRTKLGPNRKASEFERWAAYQ